MKGLLGLVGLALVAGGWGTMLAQKSPSYAVTWDSLGKDHRDSMPIGNGDVGANVWTEANGDLVLLIAKTDAWSENGQLVKVGQVRVRMSPSPWVGGKGFRQTLDVRRGVVEIAAESGAWMRVWVDANRAVIHVEYKSPVAVKAEARVELWRTEKRETAANSYEAKTALREINRSDGVIDFDPDVVLAAGAHEIGWAHENLRSVYPMAFEDQHLGALLGKYPDPLLHRVFGAVVTGPKMVSVDDHTLGSMRAMTAGRMDVVVLGEHPVELARWKRDADALAAKIEAVPVERAWMEHELWWRKFWERSWIDVSGGKDADAVTQGYAMQRWMVGAAGRGAQAMKFNGSIFTVGDIATDGKGAVSDLASGPLDADFRKWGSNYWFQNERHLYWPMIAAGDADLLQPFFAMYRGDLRLEEDVTRIYSKHGGARFPETMYFWGTPNNVDFGWGNPDMAMTNGFIRNHINGGLEVSMMMMDEYGQTEDAKFARETMLPVAEAVVTYFDEHWKRVKGKILMEDSQSLETDRPSVNPAPDVAGLRALLPRLLGLPVGLTTTEERVQWKRMLAEVPELPRGRTNKAGVHPEPETEADAKGKEILWTAERWTPMSDGKPGNSENPELYAVFPYRLFGVGMPELQLARDTFAARRFKAMTCWTQDGIDAADLGMADEARRQVVANFTTYGVERFGWFWAKGHDWEPDMDNGGAGMMTLQSMLLQTRGRQDAVVPGVAEGVGGGLQAAWTAQHDSGGEICGGKSGAATSDAG
ncbi:MAG: DUF5703 domain-containing protein [Acidobacteriota bacterium]